MTLAKINDLLTEAHEATAAAQAARTEGLPDVIRAVRALESALVAALDGEPLRGLKNIGAAGVTIYAARVRSSPDVKIPHYNERGSATEYLCIDTHGQLVTLWWSDGQDSEEPRWELLSKPMADKYLRVDDIENLSKTLAEVLPRHVKSARKNGGRYRTLQQLAIRIREALAEGGE